MAESNTVVEIAKSYYDSNDADEFYFNIWGGEDIHIGIYDPPGIPVKEASRNTVDTIASHVTHKLTKDSKVLDLGAGYGGAARHIAKKFACHVTCLNLSTVENERNRSLSSEQGVGHLIDVVDGNFEELPFESGSFDLVWSEDAILHSGDKAKVFQEVSRVLKPGGEFIFTDPMQVDNVEPGVLKPIYERIHLDSMGSVSLYKELGEKNGFSFKNFQDLSKYLPIHYGTIRSIVQEKRAEYSGKISDEFLDRMILGLGHWVEGGNKGHLAWGILHFQKA